MKGIGTMTGKNIIKTLSYYRRITQQELADRLGAKSQGTIGNMFRSKHDIRTDSLVSMAEVLGCDVVVRERSTGKEWKVTLSDDDPMDFNPY